MRVGRCEQFCRQRTAVPNRPARRPRQIITANDAKYTNGIPNHFRVFGVFRGLEFPVTGDGADTAPLQLMMSPRRMLK